MGIYVYCPRASQGAMALTEAVEGTRLRRFDGMDLWRGRHRVRLDGDVVVCWGNSLPNVEGAKVLNGVKYISKLQAAVQLGNKGIQTVRVLDTNPKNAIFSSSLQRAEWLPRNNDHVGGNDLLKPPKRPDFWTLKEQFVREYRVHVFRKKCIRSGQKMAREGVAQHPWIRSWDGGWKISYDGFESTKEMRKLARAAVAALGLSFGAVDIAEKKDRTLVVLEVNRAPGLEGNTIASYAKHIKEWANDGGRDAGGDED